MILLLDTHTLIWSLGEPTRLAANARAAIADPENDVLVSAATVWAIAIKRGLGKLRLEADLPTEIDRIGFAGLPVSIVDGQAAGALPRHHDDPFDRMLVAQAQRLDAVVVSRDRAFANYDVKVLTA